MGCVVLLNVDSQFETIFAINHRYGSAAVASALLLVTVDGSHHGKILELQVIHKCGLFHTHLHKKIFSMISNILKKLWRCKK